MESRAFSQDDFAEWSKNHIAYLHVSTRLDGKKHEGLFKEKGFRGFPSFCVMDASGQVVAKHAGTRDVAGFTATVAKGKDYVALREAASSGDSVAKMQLFVKDLELGSMSFARGSLKFAVLEDEMPARLQREAKAHLATLLFNEIQAGLIAKSRAGMDRAEYMHEYETTMLEFFESGNIPAGYAANSVLSTVFRVAQKRKDTELFAKALDVFKARFEGDQYYGRRIAQYERQLESMRQ